MFRGFPVVPVAASVLCGAVAFLLFKLNLPSDFGPGGGFAVLVFDETQDDRHIRETLAFGGLDGLISKSSQNVPIDDFGSLRMVPLDTFRDAIEPFDPRDTGYAGRLKSFFVQDGQRFFFLPVDSARAGSAASLDRQVAALLPGVPFTLALPGERPPPLRYFPLLVAASLAALCVSRHRRFFALGLAALPALAYSGPFAFPLAAALCAVQELLREPVGELAAARRYGRRDYAGYGFAGLWEKLTPFRLNCLLALLFTGLFALFSALAGLSPVLTAAALAALCLPRALAFRHDSRPAGERRRLPFTPAPMTPFRARTFSLFPVLLPFGLASALAVFLPAVVPGNSPSTQNESPLNLAYLVSAEEYYQHTEFQLLFSFSRLDWGPEAGQWPLIQEPFLRYYLGEDGLIAGAADSAVSFQAAPPFPLEKLTRFLLHYDSTPNRGFQAPGAFLFTAKELMLAAMILTAWALDLFQQALRTRRGRPLS
ncbi:MAG: hypothetical protein FWC64_01480 [Treponema sp.]|nr:hypothetical protein [Treponema sp.]